MTKKERVLADAKKLIAGLVFNMTSHEGNPMTFPEVKTLVDGITVGGHKISDYEQVKNIELAWRKLFELVEADQFTVNRSTIEALHKIYAQNEALEWGVFRNGSVSIAGTDFRPPNHEILTKLFAGMLGNYESNPDRDDASYDLFLSCALAQYFHDGNKRAGQYLMNGARLSNGLPIVTIPAKRNLEYNEKMINFYDSVHLKGLPSIGSCTRFFDAADSAEIKLFLASCRVDHEPDYAPSQGSTLSMR